ncbi:hypothetical protein BGW41_003425 [Actinomortierella wolfii]|nr:hypothetical protein BGW41_003425 [Actinomortierella wolfii]
MAATSPRSTASSTRAGLPPKTTRTNLKKIKRPSNAFFIYRRMLAKKCRGIAATDLSRIIGKLWKDEPPKVKAYFARLAQQESDMHAIAFPNYKFTPVQRGLGKRGRQLAAIQAARASGDPLPLPPPPVGHRIKPETSKNIECLLRNVRERILPGDFLDGEPKDSPPEILPPSWRVNGIDNTGSTSSSKSSSRTNTRSNRGRSRGIQADSTTQSKMTGRKQDGYITINDSSSLLTVKIKKEEDTEYQVKSRGKNKNGFSSSCSPAEAAEEPELKCLAKREPRSPSCSSTSSLSSCGSDAFLSSSEDEEDEMDLGDDAKDEDYVPSARQRQRYHKRTVHNTTTTTTTTTTGQSTRRDYHVSRCSRAAFMPMTPMSPESECEPDSAPVPCATEPSHHAIVNNATITIIITVFFTIVVRVSPDVLHIAASFASNDGTLII